MKGLRFLVVEGYSIEGREDLQAGGASLASELYAKMLKRWAPGADEAGGGRGKLRPWDTTGQQRLTVTLPDRASLDNLADSLARLLSVHEGKQD